MQNIQTRKNSYCVEDAFFGDSGKGSVVAKFNRILSQKGQVVSLLIPHFEEFDGWDGSALKKISSSNDLPIQAKNYLQFLEESIAPVGFGTTGPDIDEFISWEKM